MSEGDDIAAWLRRLQKLVRATKIKKPQEVASTFVVEGEDNEPTNVCLTFKEVGMFSTVVGLLESDLRFEHLFDARAVLRGFVADCLRKTDRDQVPIFLNLHERVPQNDICFIAVRDLVVKREIEIGPLRLLPPNAPEMPIKDPGPHVTGIVAVPTLGTNTIAMVDRARAEAELQLRRLRVALRADPWIPDEQLRFRLDRQFALASGGSGVVMESDVSWDLELGDDLIEKASREPIMRLAGTPEGRLGRQFDLAVRWIEAAYLTGDPELKTLQLCFALEAILGRKSDQLKGERIAFRRAVLGQVMSGGFTDPDRVFDIYRQARSATAHGEIAERVPERELTVFSWDVRLAVNEAISYSADGNHTTREDLLRGLESTDEWTETAEWLRQRGQKKWRKFLEQLAKPPENGRS